MSSEVTGEAMESENPTGVSAAPERATAAGRTRVRQTAILVAGLDEAGAPELTRMLNIAGCRIPGMDGAPKPEPGYRDAWSSERIVELNRELLASGGSHEEDWGSFNRAWRESSVAQHFHERALDVLREEVGDAPLFVLKDARLCRVLDFWLAVLEDYGAQPHVVIPVRNPLDAAESITEGHGCDPAAARLLWLRSMVEAERLSRGLPRSFLRYRELRSGWQGTIRKVGDDLGIAWPRRSAIAALEAEALPPPPADRWGEREAPVGDHPFLSPWLKSAFEIVDRWAQDDVRPADRDALDGIRDAFDAATAGFARIVAAGDEGIRRAAELEELLAQAASREAALAAELEERSQEMAARQSAADASLAELRGEIDGVRLRLEAAATETSRLTAAVHAAEGRATELASVIEQRERERSELASVVEQRERERSELARQVASLEGQVQALTRKLAQSETLVDEVRARRDDLRWQRNRQREQLSRQRAELKEQRGEIRRLQKELAAVYGSSSWRLTAPLRFLSGALRGSSPAAGPRRSRRAAQPMELPPRRPIRIPPAGAIGEVTFTAAALPQDPRYATFSALGELLGITPEDLTQELERRREDLESRLRHGVLGEMILRAAELDPLINHDDSPTRLNLPPFHLPHRVKEVVAMRRLHEAAGMRTARAVVVAPGPAPADPDVADRLRVALSSVFGPREIVVVRTDTRGLKAPVRGRVTRRAIDLAAVVADLKPPSRQRVLFELLRSLRPAVVVNVDSPLFWETLAPYGRQLSATMPLLAWLSGSGGRGGREEAGRFYRYFELFNGVLSDSERMTDWLQETFQLPPGEERKLFPLSLPDDAAPERVAAFAGELGEILATVGAR